MDLAERMAVVEGRLDRVERVLGLPARRSPALVDGAPGDVPGALPARPRVEAARDLLEDPAATRLPSTSRAAAPARASTVPAEPTAPDLLAPAGVVGPRLPSLPRRPAPPPVPAPPSPSAPPARTRPAVARVAPRRTPVAPAPGGRGDMERFVGVTILGRVGIAAVLLAAGYFAQLAYAAFPPALRVASIYALAGLLIGVGALVRSRVAPRYVGILWGGGVAAAYMAGVVARMRYALFPEGVALAALVASCALGQVLAKSLRQRTLALVALAGALAAPVLVGGPDDARTVLLVYLLTLHAWAWFIERRHGATGARLLALLGVGVVAFLWVVQHGRVDLSTCVHLHVYLFGLTFPEWAGLARGRGIPRRAAIATAILAGVSEAAMLGAFAIARGGFTAERYLVHRFLLVAGLAWALPPILGRLRAGEARSGSTELTRLAGVCLAVGLFFFAGDASWPTASLGFQGVLVALAAFAAASVWAGPRLGAGDLAATCSSALSLLLLISLDPRDPVRVAAFVGPVALLLGGTRPLSRIAGLALGLFAAFGGIVRDPSAWRPVVCVALAAAVAGVAFLRARRLRDEALASFADLALVALACFGAWGALEPRAMHGAFRLVSPALLNPGTVAAAVLVGALGLRLRAGRGEAAMPSGVEPLLRTVLGALLVAAGGREVHAALGDVAALDLRAALGTLYLAAAGSVFLAVSARRRDPFLAFEGLACLVLAVGLGIAHGRVPGRGWVSGVELTGLVAAVAAGSWLLRSASAATRLALGGLAAAIGIAWVRHVVAGRFGAEIALLNPRTLVAGLTVALLVVLRGRTREPVLGPVRIGLGFLAAGLAFGAGLAEVLDAVADLPSGPIRSVLVSVYAMVFSALLLFVGFRRRALEVRWLALAGFAVTIGKVGLNDLSSVETPWRILVTGCLGVVLLGSAYAYARRDRGTAPAPGDEDPRPDGADPAPPPPAPPAS